MGEAVKIHQMEENSIPQLSVSDLGTDTSSSLFQRRIEFHLASKPFTGFISAKNSGGFQLETLNPKSETLRGNGALSTAGKKVGNVADTVMESNGFDPEVSLGIAFRKIMRIGAGLQNLGNTCFLNAVLQCLTYTEPLAAYLESGKHQNSCRMAGFCALCAIQKHVSRALQATGKILAPKDLVSNLRCISRKFQNARQEDAHEYMVNLLESMHKCCLPSGVPSESPSAYEKSLVHKIFGGRLRSQVKCVQCNYCSDKFDPFLDLSLEILKADSLHKALEHFTARELLDGGQREYQCQQCKQKVKATKRLTIDKAPPVLTIHLKRFGSYVGQKIDKKIHYGPTLDLQKFVSGSYGDELKYTLYGVLVHAGWSTHSGHYYCFVRTSSGNWYSLDDNRVVQVNERKVLEQKAYMLFYVRDRKSPVPKKPMVDVAHTGNMITNGTGNKMYSNHTQRVKDTVLNGFHVKNADSINGAKVEREKLNPKVSEGISTECLVPPEVNEVADDGRVVKPENLSRVPGTAYGGKEPSVVDTKVEPCANPTVPLSNGLRKFENKCNVPLPNGNVDSKELTCSVIPFSANNLKHEACNNGNTNSQVVKDISNGSFGDSAGEVNSDVGQRNVGTKPDGVVSQLTMTSSSAKEEPLGKTCLKAKKKSFKSRVISMHLSFMMLDPALGLHRKKKLKRMKHKIGRKKRRNPCSSDANKAAPDLGPSTSEVSHTSISSKLSAKRKSKSGPNDGDNANHDVRVVNNATILANNKQPQKCCNSSPSIRNQGDNATQRGLMDMLTRGLESRVARWNDVEVPPLDGIEQNVDGVATIGYIGDEWDEHYDMGKRKKVRSSKNEFGGPNPFQEAASKKALNKARHERSSSANQPFRI